MKPSVERWSQRFYDRRRGWIDGTTRFTTMIRDRVRPEMTLLDLGAGPGADLAITLQGSCRTVIGLDPDEDIRANRKVDVRIRGSAEAIPLMDASVDLVFSDWVVEHLPEPEPAMREAKRILRPGGHLLFRTGNLRHYVYAIAAVTPHWFHRLVANAARGLPDEVGDPHPTYYRMNTLAAVRRILGSVGLQEEQLIAVEAQPSYLVFSVPTFLLGVAYERVVNRWSGLSNLRASLLGCYRKPL